MKNILTIIFEFILKIAGHKKSFMKNMGKLTKGMKRTEMLKVLGKPTKIEKLPNGSVAIYLNDKLMDYKMLPNGSWKEIKNKGEPQYINHHVFFDSEDNCIGFMTDPKTYNSEKYIFHINEFKKNRKISD